jgi:hypothetical protein
MPIECSLGAESTTLSACEVLWSCCRHLAEYIPQTSLVIEETTETAKCLCALLGTECSVGLVEGSLYVIILEGRLELGVVEESTSQ